MKKIHSVHTIRSIRSDPWDATIHFWRFAVAVTAGSSPTGRGAAGQRSHGDRGSEIAAFVELRTQQAAGLFVARGGLTEFAGGDAGQGDHLAPAECRTHV